MAITPEQEQTALELLAAGVTQVEVANRIGCSRTTIARMVGRTDFNDRLRELTNQRVLARAEIGINQRLADIREYVESQRHFSRRMRELADLLTDICTESVETIIEHGRGCSEKNLASIARTIPLLVECAADAQARVAGIEQIVESYEQQASEDRT